MLYVEIIWPQLFNSFKFYERNFHLIASSGIYKIRSHSCENNVITPP